MKYKDYYQVLGVSREAPQDEIKRAYRKLARKYHPDVSREPDAEARFKELNEANEVLKDPKKRAAYDQLGGAWRAGEDFSPPPGWNTGFEYRGGDSARSGAREFSDFFESLFGAAAPFSGAHIHLDEQFAPADHGRAEQIVIDLDEAYSGTTRTLQLEVPEYDARGNPSRQTLTLNVKIPAGITDGQRIRLAKPGSTSPRRKSGTVDLYLEVKIRPHRLFRLDGRDVYLNLPLAPWEAALGARIEVPALGANITLRIPAGTQSGAKLRLKGRGLPGTPPGDQYAVAQIMLPGAATDAHRKLYERMAVEMPFDPRAAWKTTR